jgi:hypothetical protein
MYTICHSTAAGHKAGGFFYPPGNLRGGIGVYGQMVIAGLTDCAEGENPLG